ncbi:uncharacterized protein B0I36DRAFT_331354 [Microdochium trichocladiopsis]|uniref:Protein-S-isoprenylcysteine O-methyltransferase n=1 Tax=Microdochium trichocladiopsis TaxID=1682393 RepID=A0A9P8XX17_9PEZI|nr:uncharacterized protein B0I36DRAFT_331354 [Microdochium trichocladiopsis]KAH7024406.1 hypothetical protein B0I36DRAFT_331354 [Microdochium trichocladiopsis]
MHAAARDVELGLVRPQDLESPPSPSASGSPAAASWLAWPRRALASGNALPAVLFAVALAGLSTAAVLIHVRWPHSDHWRVPAYLASISAHHLLEACVAARHRGGPLFSHQQDYFDMDEYDCSPIRPFLSGIDSWPIYAVASVECIVRFSAPRIYYLAFFEIPPLTVVGIHLMLAGHVLRALALLHASSAVRSQLASDAPGAETRPLLLDKDKPMRPVLLTTGAYRFLRHPGYLGLLLWTVGSQFMVCPGLVFPTFTVSMGPIICFTWAHLVGRIRKEERWLERTFGQAYADYKERSWTLIPFA